MKMTQTVTLSVGNAKTGAMMETIMLDVLGTMVIVVGVTLGHIIALLANAWILLLVSL